MNASPIVSVIVVNWNVSDYLRECLVSLGRETRLHPDDYEVIVIDNASTDGSADMVRSQFPSATFIQNDKNVGFGSACNQGFALSRGDYIFLLNPDTSIQDGALGRALEKMRADVRIGVLGCCLIGADGRFQRATGGALPTLRNVSWNYLFLNRLLPKVWAPPALFLSERPSGTIPVEWVSGAAMLLRRRALGDRLFDESYFMFGEDMEVCRRVANDGWSIVCSGEAQVLHHHGRSYAQQSSAEILAAAIHGPRQFFARSHGRTAAKLYDLILLCGFLMRWPIFGVLETLRRNRGYGVLSTLSRKYAGIAARNLLE